MPEPLSAISAGFHSSSSYHQRRGQAHLETNDETPEPSSAPPWRREREIGMGIAYPVSVFAPELSACVDRLHARGGLIRRRRRSLPRSFLSPFALVIPPFRHRSHPKEGSLASAFPPRLPENNDYRPALALFFPSPILSLSSLLFASGHSTPYTWRFVRAQVQPAFLTN